MFMSRIHEIEKAGVDVKVLLSFLHHLGSCSTHFHYCVPYTGPPWTLKRKKSMIVWPCLQINFLIKISPKYCWLFKCFHQPLCCNISASPKTNCFVKNAQVLLLFKQTNKNAQYFSLNPHLRTEEPRTFQADCSPTHLPTPALQWTMIGELLFPLGWKKVRNRNSGEQAKVFGAIPHLSF